MEQKTTQVDIHSSHAQVHPPAHRRSLYGAIELIKSSKSGQSVKAKGNGVNRTIHSSFGFECTFEISDTLQGRIKQQGLTFELFVNGESFTSMSQKDYGYCKY